MITCPKCGYEFDPELDVDSFRSFFREVVNKYPGFVKVILEEIPRNTEFFEEVRKVVDKEVEERIAAQKLAAKMAKQHARELKAQMSIEERIALLNTPFEMIPKELQPGTVKWPQVHNHVRMHQQDIGYQKETSGARILRFRNTYNLSQKEFCEIANVFAKKFDLPKDDKHRKQQTRIRPFDLDNYEFDNVSPKADKMVAISEAMGEPIEYFCGYGDPAVPMNDFIAARYRKPKGPKGSKSKTKAS